MDSQHQIHGQDRHSAAAISGESLVPFCAICLNDICSGDSYRKLPECRHCFHEHCIDTWFGSHSTCPLCRIQVPRMISLIDNENHYNYYMQWDSLISNILFVFRNLLRKMCNPLNDELASMLCGNISCIS
ncbi:hypothetical protein ABFS83_14G154100 [Erythranthe nasuta]